MVEQLWEMFLEAGLILLILITCYGIATFLFNITIGSRIQRKKKQQAQEDLKKAQKELETAFKGLIEDLAKEENEKQKKSTKKRSKKESE